ncbi:MAG: hypothetical protein R8K49_07760 [Mariprofundaceae bacterium]
MSSAQAVKVFPKAWAPKWQRFFVAFFLSALFFNFGHILLGVRIELYLGIQAYDLAFVTSMFLLPVLTGVIVGMVYGWGGKWLAHFPPLVVLAVDYYMTMQAGAPEGARLIPLMWWGFFVILNMEFCAAGGVIGELLLKRWYGSMDLPGTADYISSDSEALPRDDGKS